MCGFIQPVRLEYPVRREDDALGSKEIPEGALYGINTQRGVDNFPFSGRTLEEFPALLRAFFEIKAAAARANMDAGELQPKIGNPIVAACDALSTDIPTGAFRVDMLEGSGGTSWNMNINEVIANKALELSNRPHGDYKTIHPNDHVNHGQSTNDVLPSAVSLAVYRESEDLVGTLRDLGWTLTRRQNETKDALRLGRTCLQDAHPMSLGQAFGGYAAVVERHAEKLEGLRNDLLVLPIGGTAVGTGFGSSPEYRERIVPRLRESTGLNIRRSANSFDGLQNADSWARFHGELRTAANSTWKIANDLIILSSGPTAGIGEIRLPELQAGSSIMPRKVNPVMPMAVCQMAFALNGNDQTIALAAQQGLLELNHFEPIMAERMLTSISLMDAVLRKFTDECIAGLEPNQHRADDNLMRSSALATALVEELGYDEVSRLVQEANVSGDAFIYVAESRGHVTRESARRALEEAVRGSRRVPASPDQSG